MSAGTLKKFIRVGFAALLAPNLASCALQAIAPQTGSVAHEDVISNAFGLLSDTLVGATGSGDLASIQASPSFHVQDVLSGNIYHGTFVIAAGWDYTRAFVGGLSCAACHGGDSPTEVSPNLRAPNCFACHGGGPDGGPFHPPGWMDPDSIFFHGELVREAGYDYTAAIALPGSLTCAACHAGLDPQQVSPNTRAPSCFQCHGGGPDGGAGHPTGWMEMTSPYFHGKAVNLAGFDGTAGNMRCSACHAGYSLHDVNTNSRAPSCYACHGGGPSGQPAHPVGWDNPFSPLFHGGFVAAAGGDFTKAVALPGSLTCNVCHAGFSPKQTSPVSTAPSCYSCHAGGPGEGPAHPAGWLDPSSPQFHGTVVQAAGCDFSKAVASPGTLTCDSCHAATTADPSPNKLAPQCSSCHNPPPCTP